MIVVDASVVVEVLLRTTASAAIEARLRADGRQVHAPHLIDLEVAQALRRYAAIGDLGPKRANTALMRLEAMPIVRYAHHDLVPRVWALRGNLTAYDAAYVALAEALDATLLTRDPKLAAAPGHSARVELI